MTSTLAWPSSLLGAPHGEPVLRIPDTWQFVGNRPVSYLDHVVLTPAAVLAVTTRFYLAAADDVHVRRAWSDIRTARGAAKLLELTLGSAAGLAHHDGDGLPDGVEVRPVLALWGPGAPHLDNGYLNVKNVLVLDPERPHLWSHLFERPPLSPATREVLLDALRTLPVNSGDAPIALAG